MDSRTSSLPYQAFLNGLRAVVIIAVVGDRVGFVSLSGGFVGVDVFLSCPAS